jgi:hypothetical protein
VIGVWEFVELGGLAEKWELEDCLLVMSDEAAVRKVWVGTCVVQGC